MVDDRVCIMVRIDKDLAEKIRADAKSELRSVSRHIAYLVGQVLEARDR